MHKLLSGQQLGRCQVGQLLGRGSMGEVYQGHHMNLDLPVAIKVLRHRAGSDVVHFRERFRREAQMMARLNHPGLVRVLDFGTEEGVDFLVMELVKGGRNLASFMARQSPLDPGLALRITANICSALSVAHQSGILHRDLKPSNILLDSLGRRLKIADLGIAWDLAEPDLNYSTWVVGTPMYISPESLRVGAIVDARSDLYSVGVILYQMLFGRTPFVGPTAQVLYSHLSVRPDWRVAPGQFLPTSTLAIVRCLLEKNPERRPATALEVALACRQEAADLAAMQQRESLREKESPREEPEAPVMVGAGFARNLETSTRLSGGLVITHTSAWERVIVWVLLLGVLCLGLIARAIR